MDGRPDFVQSVALVIGIDAYESGVPPLRTAAADATRLAGILEADHGYDVRLLTDAEASGAAITAALADLGATLGPDDRALFYFAGHGVALDGDDGPTGYLLPQDAVRGEAATYLHMPAVNEALAAVPARHMLVILDSCFSGAFRWSSTRDLVLVPEVVHQERYDRFILDPAWQALASASHDQTALDEIPGSFGDRGDEGGHSPFAEALFEALGGAADLVPAGEGNGVITASELYLYLEQAVQPATMDAGHRQTPRLWPLAKHDKGEFIFLVPGHELNLPPAPPLTYESNPWRGLESYDEGDADLFFGRDEVIGGLREHVGQHALSAVLGASGTGKSSVVKAGLIPRLKSEGWRVLPIVRPGADPLAAFGHAVAGLDAAPVMAVAGRGPAEKAPPPPPPATRAPALTTTAAVQTGAPAAPPAHGGDGLAAFAAPGGDGTSAFPAHGGDVASAPTHAAVADAVAARVGAWLAAHPDTRLVLVVDQLEELVTLTRTPAERDAALALLRRLAEAHPDRLRLVLTLRSDFEPQFDRSALEGLWARGRFVVPPFSQAELREVVERPASERVMYFDPHALVDELVEEVIQTPGGLPLLSFALSEMYVHYVDRQSDDRAIERVDYEGVGGVVGALRTRADAEYDALAEAGRETMRRVMLRMVAAEGGGIALRRVPREELVYPDAAETARVDEVVRRLTAARLVVEGIDDDGVRYVEPAHDALVRAWDRLLGWIHAEQDRVADLRFQHAMARTSAEWAEDPAANNGLLWRDAARGTVLDTLVAQEDDMLDPAALPRVARLRRGLRSVRGRSGSGESVWMSARELAFARRSIQRRTRIRLGIATLVGLIVLGGAAAFIQARIADAERKVALSRYYVNQADDALGRDPVEALVFAIGAAKATDSVTVDLRASLFRALQVPRVVFEARSEPGEFIADATFGPRGERILVTVRGDGGASDGIARVLDARTGRVLKTLGGPDAPVYEAVWSPDGQRVATVGEGEGRIWALGSDAAPVAFEAIVVGFGSLSWSPDGDRLLAHAPHPEGVRALDAATGRPLATFPPQDDRGIGGAWYVGERVLTWRSDMFGEVGLQVWGPDGGAPLYGVDVYEHAFASSPDGRVLATIDGEGGDQTLRLQDVETGDALGQVSIGPGIDARSLQFDADGDRLAVAGANGGVVSFEIIDGTPNEVDRRASAGEQVEGTDGMGSFQPVLFAGDRVLTLDDDGIVRLWNAQQSERGRRVLPTRSVVRLVETGPGGQVLTASEDGTLRLWDVDTGPELYTFGGGDEGQAYFTPGSDAVTLFGETASAWSLATGDVLPAAGAARGLPPLHPGIYVSVREGRAVFSPVGSNEPITLFDDHALPITAAASLSADRLLVADTRGSLRTIDLGTGRPVGEPVMVGMEAKRLLVSPDGRRALASESEYGDSGGTLLVDLETGRSVSFATDGLFISNAAFSPNGAFLAVPTPGRDGASVGVWDAATGEEVRALPGPVPDMLRFSSDGGRLVAAAVQDRKTIQVWDVRADAVLQTYLGHLREDNLSGVSAVAVSPDGKRVASTFGRTVRVWDVATGRDLAVVEAEGTGEFRALAFGPDGRHVVAVDGEGAARVYTLDVEDMVQLAERRLPPTLSRERREQILEL